MEKTSLSFHYLEDPLRVIFSLSLETFRASIFGNIFGKNFYELTHQEDYCVYLKIEKINRFWITSKFVEK